MLLPPPPRLQRSPQRQLVSALALRVQHYHASRAERGGGGWGNYDLKRVGERHRRTRRKGFGYEELLATARQLRGQMDALANLVCTQDRSFNAVMERVTAVMLHAAVEEEAGGTHAAEDGTTGVAASSHDEAAATAQAH